MAEPVVRALVAPAELDELEVRFGAPVGNDVDERDAAPVWMCLTAGGEHFAHRLTKATFDRWDAHSVAGDLADYLIDEIVESRFGWGQLRDVDVEAVVPPPRWPTDASGRAMLEVYPDEDALSPLWRAGINVAIEELPLSLPLGSDLLRWRSRWVALVEDDLNVTWAQVVAELEPERRRLVAGLRTDLDSTSIAVADPIALDLPLC